MEIIESLEIECWFYLIIKSIVILKFSSDMMYIF